MGFGYKNDYSDKSAVLTKKTPFGAKFKLAKGRNRAWPGSIYGQMPSDR